MLSKCHRQIFSNNYQLCSGHRETCKSVKASSVSFLVRKTLSPNVHKRHLEKKGKTEWKRPPLCYAHTDHIKVSFFIVSFIYTLERFSDVEADT